MRLIREIPAELQGCSNAELRSLLGELEYRVNQVAILGTDARVCALVVSPDDPQGDDIGALHCVFYRRENQMFVTSFNEHGKFEIDGKALKEAQITRRTRQIRFGELRFRIMIER